MKLCNDVGRPVDVEGAIESELNSSLHRLQAAASALKHVLLTDVTVHLQVSLT